MPTESKEKLLQEIEKQILEFFNGVYYYIMKLLGQKVEGDENTADTDGFGDGKFQLWK